LSDDQAMAEGTLGVLYGIYLLNYITGGLLINKFFDYYSFSKWENMQWSKPCENLDPNCLDDWPIKLCPEKDRSGVCRNNIFAPSIFIEIGAGKYGAENPNHPKNIKLGERVETIKRWKGLKQEKIARPIYQYPLSEVDDAILTGLEEAHHSLVNHFRLVQDKTIGDRDFVPNSVVEVFGSVFARESPNDYLQHALNYSAARHGEFNADLLQANYVRKYLPNTWLGYKEYIGAIKERRRSLWQRRRLGVA